MKLSAQLLLRIGLAVKGVDASLEVVGGVLLLMPARVARYLLVLSQHEAYTHHQVLAGRLDRLSESVQVHSHLGMALYLMVHGLAKIVLIAAILRGKRWGYTGLIGVLLLFTVIEAVRVITAHEILTGILGLFDLGVVILIYMEYRAKFLGAGAGAGEEEVH
ncbi:MAG: DUF2127 domain-containing protein [Fimbriimonadaceae bacterium]